MVIERVELPIQAGREGDFELALRSGIDLLKGADGCLSVTLARGVEQPSRYLLLVRWSSLEHHVDFTKTGDFTRFRELIVPFFSDKPAMHHFAPVIEKH